MAKQVYRGVEFDSASKPKNVHQHAKGLRYRGVEFDSAEALKAARAKPAGHAKIYRGAVADSATR